ncbi:MAG TPA: ABC transporter ATP-binding protein [Elusimicrobia bacterium]|nr:MAG: ABC transporter ATP-binding protein [Elusimicrobia bacterium GWF2_62_30]HBA60002.1 ABC transporter ATP-binding protein [Elusimicrobiota bacterium]
MLEVRDIKKTYGGLAALDGVSFKVNPGETLGLIGPNGAGKTTAISIMTGLLKPDSGEVLLDGRALGGDTDPAKLRLGLVPQDLALYDELSALNNLRFFGSIYGLSGRKLDEAVAGVLDLVGLSDRAGDAVRKYSGGMKRRLNLGAALLHDPQLLLLDEPTLGVDPHSRSAIFDELEALKKRGKTILYATNYMEEAERLCDRIVIIDQGRIIADDTLQGLYRRLPAANILCVELESAGEEAWAGQLKALPGVETAELRGNTITAGLKDLAAGIPSVLRWLGENGHAYRHVETERADLEAVFLSMTGRSLRDK